MKKEITFTAKQVGERVKERRTELNLTMPELGKRVGRKAIIRRDTLERFMTVNQGSLPQSTSFRIVFLPIPVHSAASSIVKPILIAVIVHLSFQNTHFATLQLSLYLFCYFLSTHFTTH